MKNFARMLLIFINAALLTIFSLSLPTYSALGASTATPGPKSKALVLPFEPQPGHTDGILILSVLIFLVIAIPILISYRNSRSQ